MKYVCFFDNGQEYYCYTEDSKIYRGKNAEGFKLNFKYLLSLFLILIIVAGCDSWVQEKLNPTAALLLIFFGIAVSVSVGIAEYNKIAKQIDRTLTEAVLSDAQFKSYVSQGKERFQLQKSAICILILLSVLLFAVFLWLNKLTIWLLGVLSVGLTVVTVSWIQPFSKHRFFKTHG